jgi:molybdate/tungstate transport system substrate-binding protein
MRILLIFALIAFLVLASGCTGTDSEKTQLRVVTAGSLLGPLAEIEADYEALHPEIDLLIEGHGSIQAIRQVTDLNRPFDVVAVADESLIPELMYRPMEGGGNYTDSCITFAKTVMVIAYTDESRYAGEITAENWHEVLARPDVRVGFSNPMLDACGYRALMVTQLAGEHYGNATLFGAIIGDHLETPPKIERSGGTVTIILPEQVRPSGGKVNIRSGSVYLLSLLEAGGIDYAFEYESVAREHGLRWIDLPPEINLGSAAYADRYREVEVQLGFQRFSSIGNLRKGLPIVYAVTIPATAPHPEEASAFVAYMLDAFSEGRDGWPEPLR